MKEHPEALLKEIAEHFGGSIPGAADALKRQKITFIKRPQAIQNATKKSEQNLTRN
jgi:hypothetical protein